MPIKFDFTGNATNLTRTLKEVQSGMHEVQTKADAASFSIKEMLKQSAAFAGFGLGAAGIKEFANSVMQTRNEIQGFETAFNVLLGSKDKAAAMFGELKQFANTTPLMLKDLAAGAQTMLGFNIEAEKVVPTLKAIGDISMGDAQRFSSLTLAFSQMSATGKLMGQDLLQMINAGFNPLMEISEKTGKSIADLKEEMSAGAISAEMVAEAFMSATSKGGRFFGMLSEKGKGIAGQINTLNGAIDDMFDKIGKQSEGIITGTIQNLTTLVQNWEDVGAAIMAVAEAYGAYKAIEVATTTFNTNATNMAYDAELQALQALIPVKQEAVAADLQQAMASGTLTAEKADQIAALRLEAQTQLESLRATQAKAAADYAAAREEHRLAVERLAVARSQSAIALASGNAQEIEAAKRAEAAAATEAHTAAMQRNTARQALNTATTNANAAATQIDTASQEADAAATGVLAQAKLALHRAILLVNQSFLASPLFWIAATIAGVTFAVYKLVTAETAQKKAVRESAEAWDEFYKNQSNSKSDADKALQTIRDTTSSVTEQYRALNKLNELFPELIKNYDTIEKLRNADSKDVTRIINESMESNELKNAQKEVDDAKRKIASYNAVKNTVYVKDKIDEAEQRLKIAQERLAKIQEEQRKAKELFASETNEPVKKDKAYWEGLKKTAQDALDKLTAENAASSKGAALKKQIAEYDKKIASYSSYSATVKKDDTIRQLAEDAKRLTDLREQYGIEERRKAIDIELDTRQAILDTQADSSAKRIAQIHLSYDREKEAIEREEEDLRLKREAAARTLWEAENAQTVRDNPDAWRTSGQQQRWLDAYRPDISYFREKQKAAASKRDASLEAEKQARQQQLDELLSQYGTYQEQLEAITRRYQQRIEQAKADGSTRLVQVLESQLEQEKTAIMDKFGQAEKGVEDIFTDLETKSREAVTAAISAYQQLLDAMADGTLTPEEADSLTTIGFSASFLQQVQQGKVDADALRQALSRLRQQADDTDTTIHKLGQAFRDAFDGDRSPEERVQSLLTALSSVQRAVSMVTDTVANMADAFGNTGLADTMDDISNALGSTISMAQQGAAIGGPIGAAAGAAMGLASSLTQIFTRRHDNRLQRQIEQTESKVKALDAAFTDLQDKVEQTFGQRKSTAIREQIQNLEQQNTLIRQQIQLEERKRKTDKDAVESYRQAIQDNQRQIAQLQHEAEDAIFGSDLQSAIASFADAYADAWASSTSRVRTAKEQVREMMQQMVRESIKSAVQASDAMEQIRRKMTDFYRDGILSDAEQQALYRDAERIQADLDRQFGWADGLLDDSKSFTRQGSSGGFKTMSQDSADELNGRFTALQIGQQQQIAQGVQLLSGQDRANAYLSDLLTAAAIRNGYLTDIIDLLNRHHAATMQRIEAIQTNTSRL